MSNSDASIEACFHFLGLGTQRICKLTNSNMLFLTNVSQNCKERIISAIEAPVDNNFQFSQCQTYMSAFTITIFYAVYSALGRVLRKPTISVTLIIILNFVQFHVHFVMKHFSLMTIAKLMRNDFMKKLTIVTNVTSVHLPIMRNPVYDFINQKTIRLNFKFDLHVIRPITLLD